MPYKDKIKNISYHAKYSKDHYRKNKEKYKKRTMRRRQEMNDWYFEYKKKFKCEKCGFNDFRCIDFDHKDRKIKFMGVSKMIRYGFSKYRIIEEIKKCNPLCANCHRIKTWDNKEYKTLEES